MASDPGYVRLAARLTQGMVCDLESGWSVAGLDVKEFPKDNPNAARFVRNALNAGKLEPAGKAEYDEVHENDIVAEEMRRQHPEVDVTHQEHRIQEKIRDATARVLEARGFDPDSELEAQTKARDERREKLVKDSSEFDSSDPEEQVERFSDTRRQVAQDSKKKKKGKKPAAASSESGS